MAQQYVKDANGKINKKSTTLLKETIRNEFEIEIRAMHISKIDMDPVDTYCGFIKFLKDKGIPHLRIAPKHFYEFDSDILLSATKKELIKICKYLTSNGLSLRCLHFPVGTKGLPIGIPIEDQSHFITHETLGGVLEIFDAYKFIFEKEMQ